MTWIGAAVPVGDEVFFYYGGYARGHKVAPATERQIGLARMKRDRYLGLAPSNDEGRFVTRPFVVPDGRLTVNARATRGAVFVRLLDPAGNPLDDLGRRGGAPSRRRPARGRGALARVDGEAPRQARAARVPVAEGGDVWLRVLCLIPRGVDRPAVGRPLPLAGPGLTSDNRPFPDEPGRTSFTNPAIPYTVPDEAYAVLGRGEVEAVVVATGPSTTASSAGIAPVTAPWPRSGTADVARTCSSRPRPGRTSSRSTTGRPSPGKSSSSLETRRWNLRRDDDHTAELD